MERLRVTRTARILLSPQAPLPPPDTHTIVEVDLLHSEVCDFAALEAVNVLGKKARERNQTVRLTNLDHQSARSLSKARDLLTNVTITVRTAHQVAPEAPEPGLEVEIDEQDEAVPAIEEMRGSDEA